MGTKLTTATEWPTSPMSAINCSYGCSDFWQDSNNHRSAGTEVSNNQFIEKANYCCFGQSLFILYLAIFPSIFA